LRRGSTIAIVSGDSKRAAETPANFPETNMVQTTNRFFDDVARLMNDAAGVAQGLRREAETLFRSQAERILNDLAVVQREEFEAVREMARLAREDNEKLRARVAALEAQMTGSNLAAQTAVAGATEPSPTGYFA
jgi:BMFP domain-containing protein YqiC